MEEWGKIMIPGEKFHFEITHNAENKLLLIAISNNPYEELSEEDREKIEKDIKDLGKWRKFKELKKDLES